MKTIKVAMIGLGGMGNFHTETIENIEGVEIVGVCDLIEEKAKKIGQKLNVPWYLDYHKLLDKAEAVMVCTEPFNRRDIVVTCAKQGKHIFTEKPIANNLEDAYAMLEATASAGVIYMLGYCMRFYNPYKLMKQSFESGELGDLVECWSRRFMPADMTNLWYGWQEKSGGVMLDFASHDIDWLRWIGGDAESVFGYARQMNPAMHAFDHGYVTLRFENGGIGSASNSWSSNMGECSTGIVGTKGAIIVGKDDIIRKKIGDGEEIVLAEEAITLVNPQGEVGTKDESGKIRRIESPEENIQQHFFRCIREKTTPLTTGADGLKTLATVIALHKSNQTGEAVKVRDILG